MITFAEFLKKYSTIPNQFIDDLFKILNYNDYDDKFFIDFDKVVKWLGQRKDSTKRTLVDNFIKNINNELRIGGSNINIGGIHITNKIEIEKEKFIINIII